jgi:hypothetical protein
LFNLNHLTMNDQKNEGDEQLGGGLETHFAPSSVRDIIAKGLSAEEAQKIQAFVSDACICCDDFGHLYPLFIHADIVTYLSKMNDSVSQGEVCVLPMTPKQERYRLLVANGYMRQRYVSKVYTRKTDGVSVTLMLPCALATQKLISTCQVFTLGKDPHSN